MGKKTLKQNALVLTVAGFIVKTIGFFYRIYIANTIGAEGMGLFQLVLPVYNLILLGLTAGTGIAISRLVAEETARGNHKKSIQVAWLAGSAIFILSIPISGVLLMNIEFLANTLVGDIRTKSALICLLPPIPVIAGLSALKGYFYGKQEMIPNAVSQVAEQATKLIVVYTIAHFFVYGNMEEKCLFATIGMIAGELANVFVVYGAFLVRKRKLHLRQIRMKTGKKQMGRALLKISVPIASNRLILSLLGTIEFLWIPQRLALYGLTAGEALTEYGKLTGMAAPIVSFPSMLTAALAIALVPAIAESVAMKKMAGANRQISYSIRATLVLGFLFTSLFISFSKEISDLVYPDQNVGGMLFLLSFTGVFFYLQQTLSGILNGLGKETSTLKHSMITGVCRLAFVWFGIPVFGLAAYITALVFSNLLGAVLNLRTAVKTTGMSIEIGEWFIKPLIAAISGMLVAPVIKMLAESVLHHAGLQLIISSGTAGGLMIGLLMLMGVFSFADLRRMVPFNIDKYRKL